MTTIAEIFTPFEQTANKDLILKIYRADTYWLLWRNENDTFEVCFDQRRNNVRFQTFQIKPVYECLSDDMLNLTIKQAKKLEDYITKTYFSA